MTMLVLGVVFLCLVGLALMVGARTNTYDID